MDSMELRLKQFSDLVGQSALPEKDELTRILSHPNLFTRAYSGDLSKVSDEILEDCYFLDLSDLALTAIPPRVAKARRLKVLNLSYNNILDFGGLEALQELEYLIIENAHLKIMPAELFKLPKLRYLSMKGNELYYVTHRISRLEKLLFLELGSNMLSMLPDQVGECRNLIYLNASQNSIAFIPEGLGRLGFLTILDLSNNELAGIPPSLGELIHLRELNLMFNNLAEIPSTIAYLEKLETLNLNNNQINDLPEEILRLKKLSEITIEGNPLFHMPELKNSGISNLRSYFNEPPSPPPAETAEPQGFEDKFSKALQDYLQQFSAFYKKTAGKEFALNVHNTGRGYTIFPEQGEIDGEIAGKYLNQFSETIKYQSQELTRVKEKTQKHNYQIFELKQGLREYENEKQNLEYRLQSYHDKITLLKGTIKEQRDLIEGLKFQVKYYQPAGQPQNNKAQAHHEPVVVNIDNNPVLSPSFSAAPQFSNQNQSSDPTPRNGKNGHNARHEIDLEQLLLDLYFKALRMQERKYTRKIEDLHNDEFTDFLRDKGYIVTDQTYSGVSGGTANQGGRLDMMIRRENGSPVSIIEAFRLSSCGKNNKVITSHIYKLLHNYDTAGHQTNFVLIYAESGDFPTLWEKYSIFLENLNQKQGFQGAKYPLVSFKNTGMSDVSGVKVGLAKHKRDQQLIKIYHIFIDMHVEMQEEFLHV